MSKLTENETKQYVSFKLGKEEYGMDIQYVQIIEKNLIMTRVPKSPDFIEGVINLRGEIIPVMNLRKKFGLELKGYNDATRIIIVKIEDSLIGLIVDEVKEVLQINTEEIDNVQGFEYEIDLNFINGVAKLDQRIVTLLNMKNLINSVLEEVQISANNR